MLTPTPVNQSHVPPRAYLQTLQALTCSLASRPLLKLFPRPEMPFPPPLILEQAHGRRHQAPLLDDCMYTPPLSGTGHCCCLFAGPGPSSSQSFQKPMGWVGLVWGCPAFPALWETWREPTVCSQLPPARRARGPHMCEVSCVRELRPLPPTPSRSALPSAWRRVRLMRQMWLRASMNSTSFSLVVLIWL